MQDVINLILYARRNDAGKETTMTTTINIVEVLNEQIEPAKAAIAARWFANRKERIFEMQCTSVRALGDRATMQRHANSPHARRTGCPAELDFNPFAGDHWDKASRNRYENDLFRLFDRSTEYVETTETERGIMYLETYTPKSDEYLLEQAAEFAELAWQEYLGKMSKKFAKIGVLSIKVYGDDPIQNVLIVEAVNGVTFTVDNSIVLKMSANGKLFNQFPARFGKVQQNGDYVKNAASQKRVEELTA